MGETSGAVNYLGETSGAVNYLGETSGAVNYGGPGTYEQDFVGTFETTFTGNFLGALINNATTTIETYTLYVRTA